MADELQPSTPSQSTDPGVSSVPASESGQPSTGVNEGTASVAAAPTSSAQVTGQATGAAEASQAPAWQSIREAAYNQYGLDMRNLPDDQTALRQLISQATQAQQSQQYAQRYLQHATQFEGWLQSQQQQQAQKPAAWWNPPEYNPAWKGLVSRDPDTGEFKTAPGAPPDILPKYLAYEQYRRDFADKLTSDPAETLKPFIQELARQEAQSMVQQHLSTYQDQVYADNYVQQNSNWLHARDPNTKQLLTDPFTKQPLLSAAGQRFKGYIEQLHQGGVTNLKLQEQLARNMVERDVAMAQLAQIQQGQTNTDIKNQFIQQNNTRQPNQSGVLTPAANGDALPANQRLSLFDRLSQNFRANGITDAEFATAR